jgi:hypothetical protein
MLQGASFTVEEFLAEYHASRTAAATTTVAAESRGGSDGFPQQLSSADVHAALGSGALRWESRDGTGRSCAWALRADLRSPQVGGEEREMSQVGSMQLIASNVAVPRLLRRKDMQGSSSSSFDA